MRLHCLFVYPSDHVNTQSGDLQVLLFFSLHDSAFIKKNFEVHINPNELLVILNKNEIH